MRFRRLKSWEKELYVTAHPDSVFGDPNEADKHGLDLIASFGSPNGLMIYKRRPWWRF